MTPWGIMIQTDTHGEDVDAAAADDDYIVFVVFSCQKTFFYLLREIVFAMTTKMYANITDIVQLQYISSFEDRRCVVLLCCRWYNLFSRIAKPRADDYFKSINVKAAYQANEPFILANQATQIFFLEDTFARSDDW